MIKEKLERIYGIREESANQKGNNRTEQENTNHEINKRYRKIK